MTAREISVGELVERLQRAHDPSMPAFVAFDGDGTLWSGDIGEDVFHHFVSRQLIVDEALEPLDALAARFGIQTAGPPSERARALFDAYLEERLPEQSACEMMTWVYAGWPVDALENEIRGALAAADLNARMYGELRHVVAAARDRAIRTLVVSASPAIAVRQAVESWGFGPEDVVAGLASTHGDRLAGEMAEPLPYGPGKVAAARRTIGDAHWLASFGDNGFDADMLRAAELRVAVWPKPALERRLAEIVGAVVVRPRRAF